MNTDEDHHPPSLEETPAAVTAKDPVVFAGRPVPTHQAQGLGLLAAVVVVVGAEGGERGVWSVRSVDQLPALGGYLQINTITLCS